jgi:hypothetical protein
LEASVEDGEMIYDLIVVGSGNGACGFLSHYLQASSNNCPPERVVVVEEGDDFFNTSDITHQGNWTRSYAEGKIFKLHKAFTPDGTPIISGRACTMGGGGSINYTMIHESSEWLVTHIGGTVAYWDGLKAELNKKFARIDPSKNLSLVTKHVLDKAEDVGFKRITDAICHIPNYQEGFSSLLHIFPTQFDQFGQRTNSGVSLVDWFDKRVKLKTRCRVVRLEFSSDEEKARCVGVHVKNLDTGETQCLSLSQRGKLILCAGAATPRLLWPHREKLQNYEIGQHVSDHILLPFGIYVLNQEIDATPQDVYVPVFATTVCQTEQLEEATVCGLDFFAGSFEKLWFFISHLYLAFLLPNWLKTIAIRVPWVFVIIKNSVRIFIQTVNLIVNLCWGVFKLSRGKPWNRGKELVTAIIKFNPSTEGYYTGDGSQIVLNFFAQNEQNHLNQDKAVAKRAIAKQLALMESLGNQPAWIFKWFFRLLTKIPYEQKQVDDYVDTYSKKFLLSEQHLSGGCLFGKAIDAGSNNPMDTGKVHGSANVYVADLSSVPLPRVSSQMTAYLIGFHVANQLCKEVNITPT